ncbi:MAG: cytochrome c [Gammaproteobacteria bacterium]|nr:cytochrome c [Gammaproteobacteria bacterium]
MREGIGKEGEYLFPAFPYDHFSLVTDDDLRALYAYLMTRTPSSAETPDNGLRFPFNVRLLQAGWQLLFFREGPYEPVAGRSDAWNRGAYLAEGLGHCGACHTPRNRAGAEQQDRAYAGALIDDWYAPAIDARPTAPLGWSEQALYDYLRNGMTPRHGVAVGSMGPVIHTGLATASDADLRAIATYFAAIGSSDRPPSPDTGTEARDRIASAQARGGPEQGRGEHIWTVACASCHYNDPENPQALRPDMSLNSAVTAPDPAST